MLGKRLVFWYIHKMNGAPLFLIPLCRRILTCVMLLAILAATAISDSAVDPVVEYHCRRAASIFNAHDPNQRGAAFALDFRSYLRRLDDHGNQIHTDSAEGRWYFGFGQLDSQTVKYATDKRLRQPINYPPNVFEHQYEFFCFPNDTGGAQLAVGFDSDSLDLTSPVGLALIDRESHKLGQLYLYYPKKDGYRKYSEFYRMTTVEGLVFPDSTVVAWAKPGIIAFEYYRRETIISKVTILR